MIFLIRLKDTKKNIHTQYIQTVVFLIVIPFVHLFFLHSKPLFSKSSYKILNPKQAEAQTDPKKCAEVILDAAGLDADLFRLGNTKA